MTIFRFSGTRAAQAVLLQLMLAGAAQAAPIDVPSGLSMELYDVIIEEDTQTARFRLEVPQIDVGGAALPYEAVADDIQYLCDQVLLPSLIENGWTTGQIVVSLASRQIPFGEVAPDVTQFFQPFSISGKTCMWEDF
jgi:hypothetical protein